MDNNLPPEPILKTGIYKHYSGKEYSVVGLALHSETLQWHVMYKPLYESSVEYWVRPYTMFTETVSHNGKQVTRFSFVGDNSHK